MEITITEIITVQRTEVRKYPKDVASVLEDMELEKNSTIKAVSEFFGAWADDLQVDVQYFINDTDPEDSRNEIGYSDRREVYEKAIDKYGAKLQVQVAIEEMSELTKELCKDIRGNGVRENIVEELADATIMLEQLRLIYDCNSDVCEEMDIKIRRLEDRIKDEQKPERDC